MATTNRKRSTDQKPARADRAVTEPTGPVTDPAADTETTDPSATLTAAYWRALDESDEATGTIPAEQLDAVKQAYLSCHGRRARAVHRHWCRRAPCRTPLPRHPAVAIRRPY